MVYQNVLLFFAKLLIIFGIRKPYNIKITIYKYIYEKLKEYITISYNYFIHIFIKSFLFPLNRSMST